ncbi:MAG: transglycosylase domain-containing protein [Coriobacteriales bacterium]
MPALKRKRRRRDRAQRRTVKFLVVFGAIVGVLFLGAFTCLCFASTWLSDLPDYSNISSYTNSGVTTVYASDRKTVLAKLYLENRIHVDGDEMSDYVREGTVATEDERFYSHHGIDPYGIVRALFVNASSGGTSEGASTITQQLVRNTVLLDEMQDRTVKRKIREMYIALKVEEMYSKDDILTMYLNVVNYGDGNYGIEAASQDYFGKHASELSLSEAAMLVGIPQSPTANNPRKHYKKALKRRAIVLERMLKNGYITQEQYDSVINKKPKLAKETGSDGSVSNIAPYFVDYVKTQLSNSGHFSQAELSHGGLNVYTTLDATAQKAANKAVESNLSSYGSEMDGALVSVDPENGNIVAMVGGRDYKKNKFNLATQMSRQAGSSFKTFTLLAALTAGVDPDNTYINSSPGTVGSNWEVSNSEGEGGGDMSITDATTYSVNTVYARLCHGLGASKVVDAAKACGITSDLQAYDSITLGTQGVNPLEMASAYATIANGGIYHEPVCVTDIVDASGETVYTHEYTAGTRAISAAVAQKATEILETVVEYGTGTGAALDTDQPCAGKTGTSEHGRDLWFCGFTPQYSTAVWCGYRTEKSTSLYGGTIPAPIWHDYMTAVLEDKSVEQFPTTTETISYKDSSNWDFS